MALDTSSFDLRRSLPLAPDRLWDVLTDTRHRGKWGAPDPNLELIAEVSDVRVGGQDRQRAGSVDAPEFFVETRWYDLVAPSRAVFTETLIFGGEAVSTSLVTYDIVAADAGSELGITVAVSSFSGPETLQEVSAGWHSGLENLQGYAAAV